MGYRLADRRRPASATSRCALRAVALVAGCRLRGGHAWDVVAVSTPLPELGLPAQYRLVCRACGESGGPTFLPGRADSAVRPQVVEEQAGRLAADARLVPVA